MKKFLGLFVWNGFKNVYTRKFHSWGIAFLFFLFIAPSVAFAFGECTANNGNAGSCGLVCFGQIDGGQGSCWPTQICCLAKTTATPTPTPTPPPIKLTSVCPADSSLGLPDGDINNKKTICSPGSMKCGTGTSAQLNYLCTAYGWRSSITCTEACNVNAPPTSTPPTTASACAADASQNLPVGKTTDTPITRCSPGTMLCGTGTGAQQKFTCTANGWRSSITCTEECGANSSIATPTPFTCKTFDYDACIKTCNGNSCKSDCGVQKDRCTPSTPMATPTSKPASNGNNGNGSGGSNGGGGNGGGSTACPASGDNCTYSDETGACYSGHTDGKGGFNVADCTYSCGPVDCPKVSSNSPSKPANKEYIECTPGDPVNSFDDISCPKGKAGTCGGHSYCVWSENGNFESDPQCETANDTCSDKNESSNSNGSGGSCKDNPTDPPDGYTWKNSCKSCSSNDDCPQNTGDEAVSAETSNWCYSGSCLMLVSGGNSSKKDNSSSKKSNDSSKKKSKNKSGSKDTNGKGNGQGSKSGNDSKNLSNQAKNEKSARDKAQKPIDKINKDRLAHGLPTLTPLPPDNGAYEAYLSSTPAQSQSSGNTPTPTPTPQPPLDEPANWKAFCGATTNTQKPYGMQLSWDTVKGAPRYAIRIDADAPSWEGDTPSPGDIVDNNVKGTVFVAQATPGAVYQWWVHSVNEGGVYSALTHKMTLKCPDTSGSGNTTTPTQGANTVGAGQLIVLP